MILGFVQNEFELIHRCGTLSLGEQNVKANRPLIGWDWEQERSDNPADWWVPEDVSVVAGSPPCSGYSTMSRADFRGEDSAANVHMNAFVSYAARVAPTIATFESVQQAYTTGRKHMQKLRGQMEEVTGKKYSLYHVLHNNLTVGGAAQRKRYFWLVSQVPFGIDPPIPHMVPTLHESIGDLEGMALTWEKQPYRRPETWWSSRRRADDGATDGHEPRRLTHAVRLRELLEWIDYEWPQGWREEDAVRECWRRHGKLPPSWDTQVDRLRNRNFDMGFNQLIRWHSHKPARVLTGNALDQAMHPIEPRTFTLREAMRIQGFPDNWRLAGLRDVKSIGVVPGKGVPVDASRWLAHWIRRSLEGRPGSMKGIPDGDREYVFRGTHNYRLVPAREGRRVFT